MEREGCYEMAESYLKITASELGVVLGCFSRRRQFSAIIAVWKKSKLPLSVPPTSDGWRFYQEKQHILRTFGLQNMWEQLLKQAAAVSTQEQLDDLLEIGFGHLFKNDIVIKKQMQALEYLAGPLVSLTDKVHERVGAAVKMVTASIAGHHIAITELAEYYDTYELIGLKSFLDLVKNCHQTFYSLRSMTNCCYGKNAEKLYVAQYNEFMEMAIDQPTMVESTTSPFVTNGGRTWHLQGRIDGRLSNGQLIEIKHRTGKGFKQLPVYELLQLHAYMYLFGKRYMKMIQCVRRANQTVSDTTVVFYNEVFWMDIMQRITKVFEFIEQMSQTDIGQECLFLLPEEQRETLMEKHFPALPVITPEEYESFIIPHA